MAIDTGLDSKPWYFGLIIGLVIAALSLWATNKYAISPINEKLAANSAELDELSKKIQQGRSAEKKLPQFREEVKRLELELEKLRRILPSSRNVEEIIKKVKALVDQGDFVLRRLVFPPELSPAEEEVYAEWPIQVQIEGTYHNLAILFNRLSNFSRIINVEQFTITALGLQGDRTINSDFIAKTFVYIEPKEDAQGTPGQTTTTTP